MATSINPTSSINLGPLTTTFIPPASCSSPVAYVDSTGVPFQIYYGGVVDSLYVAPPFPATACFPSAYPLDYTDNFGHPFYSPGICPQGYTVNITSTVGPETRGICCFSGLQNNVGMECSHDVTGTVTASLYVTLAPSSKHSIETGVKVATGSIGLYGSAIEIRWRSGDFDASKGGSTTPQSNSAVSTSISTTSSSSSLLTSQSRSVFTAPPIPTTPLGTFTADQVSSTTAKSSGAGDLAGWRTIGLVTVVAFIGSLLFSSLLEQF